MTRRLTALALALVLALSLTGCWEAEPEPDDFWGDELPPEEQETSQREPAQISDFTLPYLSGQTFDPVTCIDGVQQTVGALLYEPLFTLDASFTPQPVLCERSSCDAQALTWTFALRSAVFSDGTALTANDVLAAYRRAAVGREHVVRGEGCAVGKDCAAQREGPRQRLGVAAAAFAQHRLRRERSVEREERLVEQCADGLLHAVDAGHGVKGLAREIGQGEVGDLRRLALRCLLLLRRQLVAPEVVRLRLGLPAAGQGERKDQRERERRQPPRHRVSSVRTMTAAMPPRSPPMPRCDQ